MVIVREGGNEEAHLPEGLNNNEVTVDWSSLPDDTIIYIFSCLNYLDRANLASTCRALRILVKSPCLWQELDLRYFHDFNVAPSSLLDSYGQNTQKLYFHGHKYLQSSKNLRELIGERCQNLCDVSLSLLIARHEELVSLRLGEYCKRLTSNAVKKIAHCCQKLQRLYLSGLHRVDADAINALGKHCPDLTDIRFVNCERVDAAAFGNVPSVQFLSLSGTETLNWNAVPEQWSKLPNLIFVDVSRTDITPATISGLFSSLSSLKGIFAFNCPVLDSDPSLSSNKDLGMKLILSQFVNVIKRLTAVFGDMPTNSKNVFLDWRNSEIIGRGNERVIDWVESVISDALLYAAENGLAHFYVWKNQGITLLLNFIQSPNVETQERAVTALAALTTIDGRIVDAGIAIAVMQSGGIHPLLSLAQTWRVKLQMEAAKAIASLTIIHDVAKLVISEGGVGVLVNLIKCDRILVSEEAASGLWRLTRIQDSWDAIFDTGGIKALVDLILKWSISEVGDVVVESALGALGNLAVDEKFSREIVSAGGLRALLTAVQIGNSDKVEQQACGVLANLAMHGDKNGNNTTIGKEEEAVKALIRLSSYTGSLEVRLEAVRVLWYLSFEESIREEIVAAGGIKALVAVAKSCKDSRGLQERVAGALWGLSVREANCIAIGVEGGVAPLVMFAHSDYEEVHETAAGALWSLASIPQNAFCIIELGGVSALLHLSSSSRSRWTRFMSTLALTYLFDGRLDGIAQSHSHRLPKYVQMGSLRIDALRLIDTFLKTYCRPGVLAAAALSSSICALEQAADSIHIQKSELLRCSEIGLRRFVYMLRDPTPTLKGCAAFALAQFTVPGGRHTKLHIEVLERVAAASVLREVTAEFGVPANAKVLARVVLWNLKQTSTC